MGGGKYTLLLPKQPKLSNLLRSLLSVALPTRKLCVSI